MSEDIRWRRDAVGYGTAELVAALGELGLPPGMVTAGQDVVTVTLPDGGRITMEAGTDEYGRFWTICHLDADEVVQVQGWSMSREGMTDLVATALLSHSGEKRDGPVPCGTDTAVALLDARDAAAESRAPSCTARTTPSSTSNPGHAAPVWCWRPSVSRAGASSRRAGA